MRMRQMSTNWKSTRGLSFRMISMKGPSAAAREPDERKEAVRQEFVKEIKEILMQGEMQLVTLFHKLNSAGKRGRIHSETLLEGLLGLPILLADPENLDEDEEDGEQSSAVQWDEKERQKWLTFLVHTVMGEDKHVTFADLVVLFDWNEVKAEAPFKEQREQGDHVWVVAAEVAELLVGKFGTLKQAFTAIVKDRCLIVAACV